MQTHQILSLLPEAVPLFCVGQLSLPVRGLVLLGGNIRH